MAPPARQRVQYLRTSDDVRLAWAECGTGPPIVKAANWLTHLEYEWGNPVWRHWLDFFCAHSRFIRYDERGCGMSEWKARQLTLAQWVDDLDAVMDAAHVTGPVTLLGISQGAATCIMYALRHPERVARMILYGGYARGRYQRGTALEQREYRAIAELAITSWGKNNPTFRQVFTSRFIPGGTPEQLQWFNELCRTSTTGEVFAQLLAARGEVNIVDSLGAVTTPTLVVHARDDEVVPLEESRIIAAGIRGAEFVEVDSRNHVLLEHEPAWKRFC